MKKYRVVITDFITGSLDKEEQILGDLADIEALDAHNEEELQGRIENADAIMVYHNLSLSTETIRILGNCKLIVRCGVGVDHVDLVEARRRNIPVANVPDYGTEEVADSAVGMMLALTRGITFLNSRLRNNEGPWFYDQVVPLRRLRGRRFAIIGLGRIGTAAALRAKSLGMDVVFYDPYKPDGYDKTLGIRQMDNLAELLASAYVLSLHCPLTDETEKIINANTLAMLPERAYLVNTARGGIVDAQALVDVTASGRLAGAGIDVLEQEPPGDDNPLVQAWRDRNHPAYHRILINPHSAFYSEEGLLDMRIKGSEACRQALLGKRINNVVN